MDKRIENGLNKTPVVEIKHAYKYYGVKNVLFDFSMTIPEGVIYGLLGPSGCGKTTIVNCLTGLTILDRGEVGVKYNNKLIGYMPQDIALYEEFSIRETLYYYGHIYGMKEKSIKKNSEELLSFVDLKYKGQTISSLSGGEQRRVSFCVALLHNPKFLILDEPTVGIDPILILSIWQKLKYISSEENRTILITTHYIEEARNAHIVGLIRDGILIAESVPDVLMREQNVDTLEHAFLQLCQRQVLNSSGENKAKYEHNDERAKLKTVTQMENWRKINGQRVWALILKNFYWMKRNLWMMMFIMVLPMIQCCLMNKTIGQDPVDLRIAVVNDEFRTWISRCDTVRRLNFNKIEWLSCIYISKLQKKRLNLVPFRNTECAVRAAKSNKVWGLIHFNKNYSSALLGRVKLLEEPNSDILKQSYVQIQLDMSNYVIGNVLKRDLTSAFVEFLQEVYNNSAFSSTPIEFPIKFQLPIYGSWTTSFVHFTTPGVIILSEFYQPMMFTVGAVLMDKTVGILQRSLVSGVTILEIFITHIVIQYIVFIVQTFLIMFVLFYIFDNPLEGSVFLCLILLFMIGTTGMCFGFLIAAVCNSFTSATLIGLGSYFPFFILSGMIWPFQGMHAVLRLIGFLLPLTLAIESFRGISTRSWTFTHPKVYPGFLSSITWAIIFLVLSIIIAKYNGMSKK